VKNFQRRICLDHRSTQMHVEIGERLGRKNDRRIRDQAAGEVDALPPTTREFLDSPLGVAGKTHTLKHGIDAAGDLGRGRLCV
jgi:hypothetical protein